MLTWSMTISLFATFLKIGRGGQSVL